MEHSLRQDALYPLFHLGRWHKKNPSEPESFIAFEAQAFFEGLNRRLEILLRHIDYCTSQYDDVLL